MYDRSKIVVIGKLTFIVEHQRVTYETLAL